MLPALFALRLPTTTAIRILHFGFGGSAPRGETRAGGTPASIIMDVAPAGESTF
jgi:hypothetical protein